MEWVSDWVEKYFTIFQHYDDEGSDLKQARKPNQPNRYPGTGQPVVTLFQFAKPINVYDIARPESTTHAYTYE